MNKKKDWLRGKDFISETLHKIPTNPLPFKNERCLGKGICLERVDMIAKRISQSNYLVDEVTQAQRQVI